MTVPGTTEAEQRSGRSGSWVLGVCMGLSNILGYAFVLILSRALGPADFGAFSAVNNTALLLTLPASAFQVVVAAHQARGQRHRSGVGLAMLTGTGLTLVTLAASPLLAATFHLSSGLPVVLVALMMPAFMLTGAAQGLLLGHRRFTALALIYLSIAGARVLAAVLAAVTGAGVTGAFGWLLVAAWAPAVLALVLAARHVQRWARLELGLVRELLTSNGTLAVLLAMTSTDILLARHFLDAPTSGAYAFAALFGKVVFWGTQFVALAIVPTASGSGGEGGRTPVLRALGLVVVLGAVVTAVVALVPDLLVRAMGGAQYLGSADLLVPFTLLGTVWAMGQVLLFAEMARGQHGLTVVALLATLLGVAAVWVRLHGTAGEVLLVYAVVALVVVGAGTARFLAVGERPGGPVGSGRMG